MEGENKESNQKFTLKSTIKLLSGNEIPVLGYGTYELKGEDCLSGLEAALKMGYRHIDTASCYRNELEISKVLKKLNINRKELYITSKIAPTQQGYEEAKAACLTIIQRLDCEYLDLLLIHWPGVSKVKVDNPKNAEIRLESWRALVQMKHQGKVKDIGVSNFMKKHLQHLLKNSHQVPVINQIQAHPLLWQEDTINFCNKHHIVVEAYSPLARSFEQFMTNKTLNQLGKKYNKSVPQISLRYLMQKGMVILPKSKNEKRIKENMDIFDFEISPEDMKTMDSLHKINLRTCWNPEQITY